MFYKMYVKFTHQIKMIETKYLLQTSEIYNFIITKNFLHKANLMIQSLVDYVLERGNKDYGQFSPRKQIDQNSALFNHRKRLEFLFSDKVQSQKQQLPPNHKRISDMKAQQISGQLNYFSQKIHAQLSRKYLNLDSDLYRLQNEWLKKKIPNFYCYYFLKFSYANSYSRIHELILSQIQNMAKEKDSYWIIKKTIEAREVCLANLRKQLSQLTELDIQESLQTVKQQNQMKLKIQRNHGKDLKGFKNSGNKLQEQTGKSWKNKLELVFEAIQHLRKLSCYVVQLIKNWKTTIYNISEDPRRYRERVIFYHYEANYLLKMLWDASFVKDSILKTHFQFASHFDPFILKPIMIFESLAKKSEEQDIFLSLIKPSEKDMDKIVKSLIILAQEQYDEDQQSRFINQRKNFGQLEQRKKFIEKKREGLLSSRKQSYSQKKLPQNGANKMIHASDQENNRKALQFINDKKSDNLPNQIQQVKNQKAELNGKGKPHLQTSLNRVQKIRSVDLKKISPYLSRNQLLKKAQQVVQFEHKFRLAHNQYVQNVKKGNKSNPQMDPKTKAKMNQLIQTNKQVSNNRIFNKYIEQNVRMLDQANKRSFLYKNRIAPQQKSLSSLVGYNKVSFKDRKQAEYERNLQKYLPREISSQSQEKFYPNNNSSNSPSPIKRLSYGLKTGDDKRKGTRAVIQISDRGIKAGQQIINFQLSGNKGRNLGSILQSQDKLNLSKTVQQKLTNRTSQNQQNTTNQPQQQTNAHNNQQSNLFTSQSPQQIIILRQQPEKLQELKKSLYEQIKKQLLQELKNSQTKKQEDLNNMIEEEKRKKLQEIIQQRRLEQERRKQEEERMKIAQLEKERKKITMAVRIENIQYAEENLDQWWQEKVFKLHPEIFTSLFTLKTAQQIRVQTQSSLHCIFLRGFLQTEQISYCVLEYAHEYQSSRKFIIKYLSTKQVYSYISNFHQICEYMWRNDPVQQIQLTMYENSQNLEGVKVIQDVKQYAQRNGETYQKQLYSNIKEIKMLVYRPKSYRVQEMPFSYKNFYFSTKLKFKAELLSSAVSLSQRHQPQIDMNLQTYTSYIFLLEELFRSYLTPEQIVELRQNSTNIRRLKDIFRIVLQMERGKPMVDELSIAEGLNIQDLYVKIKDKIKPPYQKYYWNNFYDKTQDNRLLLSILQTKLQIPYKMNTAMLNDKRMYRMNIKNKLLVLKSSVYAKEDIYIVPTNNPKIRLFFMQGQNYKLMRIELFIFLNLVFNNIVEDNEKYINSMWVPQFCVTLDKQTSDKKVKRITDFSISMKKSFFLSEQIYFCNNQYIRNGFSPLPKNPDIIFKESMIFGMLHTDVEKTSTGMPLYAKLIDRNQYF